MVLRAFQWTPPYDWSRSGWFVVNGRKRGGVMGDLTADFEQVVNSMQDIRQETLNERTCAEQSARVESANRLTEVGGWRYFFL